jgi:hypothetical protein
MRRDQRAGEVLDGVHGLVHGLVRGDGEGRGGSSAVGLRREDDAPVPRAVVVGARDARVQDRDSALPGPVEDPPRGVDAARRGSAVSFR